MTILCVSHTYPLLSRPAIGEEKIIVEVEGKGNEARRGGRGFKSK
jgi:hypothetical protein